MNTWRYLQTVLDKENYGFKEINGIVSPILTNKAPAPKEMLQEIRCTCQSKDRLCESCGCAKKRLKCTIHCKCKGHCSNNREDIFFEHEE